MKIIFTIQDMGSKREVLGVTETLHTGKIATQAYSIHCHQNTVT
jgi:hypothetical protein